MSSIYSLAYLKTLSNIIFSIFKNYYNTLIWLKVCQSAKIGFLSNHFINVFILDFINTYNFYIIIIDFLSTIFGYKG